MAVHKMKLKIISGPDQFGLTTQVEEFISKIQFPDTMQIQFEVSKANSGDFSFFAFILYEEVLKK